MSDKNVQVEMTEAQLNLLVAILDVQVVNLRQEVEAKGLVGGPQRLLEKVEELNRIACAVAGYKPK